MVSEARMAISMASVNRAALLANQPNRRSAMGPDRAAFMGGGLAITRPVFWADRLRGIWFAGSVDDTPLLLVNAVGSVPMVYLMATGLPDASVT